MKEYHEKYAEEHEVVKGSDKKRFSFYKPELKYRVVADFRPINDTTAIVMKTTGKADKKFYRYGTLYFTVLTKKLQLTVYQSEQLKNDPEYDDYLFVPFTDLTSGEGSYAGGRYLDFRMTDIKMGKLRLDFNKAYNPYCAYAKGYNCPIPPRENHLDIEIKAGEKEFK